MKFQPKTKEQLSELLAAGDGAFEIVHAEEAVSKNSGNAMFVMKAKTADKNGKIAVLTCYIATEKQLRNFCYGGGLIKKYESGEVTEKDCLNAEGKCVIGIKKGEPAPDGGFYPDKNVISYFVEAEVQEQESKKDEFINDKLPEIDW